MFFLMAKMLRNTDVYWICGVLGVEHRKFMKIGILGWQEAEKK